MPLANSPLALSRPGGKCGHIFPTPSSFSLLKFLLVTTPRLQLLNKGDWSNRASRQHQQPTSNNTGDHFDVTESRHLALGTGTGMGGLDGVHISFRRGALPSLARFGDPSTRSCSSFTRRSRRPEGPHCVLTNYRKNSLACGEQDRATRLHGPIWPSQPQTPRPLPLPQHSSFTQSLLSPCRAQTPVLFSFLSFLILRALLAKLMAN